MISLSKFCLVVGSLVALTAVFFALPGLNYGVWFQSEPVSHAVLAGAILAALGLLTGLIKKSIPAEQLLHPVILFPVAIAGWSALVSPFAAYPVLSWLGSPELGDGIIFWLALAVLVAAMRVLLESEAMHRLLAFAATFICGVLTLLYALPALEAYRPYAFPDHLAFYAICLPVLFTRKREHIAAWLCTAVMVAVSGNRLAMLLLAAVPPFYLLWHYRPHMAKTIARPAIITVPILLLLATILAGSMTESSSLWSRLHLWQIVQQAITDQPSALLTGFGWGHYSEISLKYLLLDGVRMFDAEGVLQPNWEGLSTPHFHSHNLLVEALLAGGIVSLLLLLAWLLAMARHSRREGLLFLLLLAGLMSGWFQLPGSWPFTALALAAIMRQSNAAIRVAPWLPKLALALFLLGAPAVITFQSRWTLSAREQMNHHLAPRCPATMFDAGRGYAYTSQLIYGWMAEAKISQQQSLSPVMQTQAKNYLCTLEKHRERSLRLALLDAILHTELAYRPAAREEGWQASLDNLLHLAPRRSDMAAPFLFRLMERGQEQQALAFAQALYGRNPHDPVALWFMGNVLLGDDDTAAQGFEYLRQSLELGIDGIIPVPQQVINRMDTIAN